MKLFGGSGAPHLRSGKLKPLAMTSAQPSVLLPGLPTIAAAARPGYECAVLTGVFAPARTAEAIIARLNQEIARVLDFPDVNKQFAMTGVETVGSSPAEFAGKMKSDIEKPSKADKGHAHSQPSCASFCGSPATLLVNAAYVTFNPLVGVTLEPWRVSLNSCGLPNSSPIGILTFGRLCLSSTWSSGITLLRKSR